MYKINTDFKVVDSDNLHDETDYKLLMLIAMLNPSEGFGGFGETDDHTPLVFDQKGNFGELNANHYHIELIQD